MCEARLRFIAWTLALPQCTTIPNMARRSNFLWQRESNISAGCTQWNWKEPIDNPVFL
jgi:hypothetical protein